MARLIVIGGVAAGMSAAAEAKRKDESLEVIVFERGDYISYGACGLPYFLSNAAQKPEDLIMLTPEKALAEKGVMVRTRHEVIKIDAAGKKVLVKDLAGNTEQEHAYDRLVIASGASPVVPKIQGIENEKVFFLKTLSHGIRLKKFLNETRPQRAAIIGDGHIALEAAEAFRLCGVKDITLYRRNRHICWWMDADMAARVEEEAAGNGIIIADGTKITGIEAAREGAVINTGGERKETDLVFVSMGMKPNTGIVEGTGIKTGQRGAIEVNSFMETGVEGIYAAGDCATVDFLPTGERIYMPRGTTANRQGRAAGANAAGMRHEVKGVTGLVVFKFFDKEYGRAGLSQEMADAKKIEAVSETIKTVTRAGYYPGGKRIFVKLTADKNTGRLLGGQMAGGEGVSKRMDVLATAILNRMTVADMRQLDLSYAPPFGPVWDPVLTAVNALYKKFK